MIQAIVINIDTAETDGAEQNSKRVLTEIERTKIIRATMGRTEKEEISVRQNFFSMTEIKSTRIFTQFRDFI